ncbi:multidrug effflux MFS transporter [Acetobacteraceae bacterium H6797]|nr:multidrug effflux MFS transporter [Acetobacteraceae bacterium H6797]
MKGAAGQGGAFPPIWLLTAVTALGPFSMQLLIPALPGLAVHFGAPVAAAQLALTLYLVGVASGQLFLGPMSDRFGRRPVLIAGLCLYLVATVGAMLVTSLEALIVARVFQALGACSGIVLGRAIVRDAWPREQAAEKMGLIMMGMTVAPMLAPVLGAWLDGWFGWQAALAPGIVFAPILLWAVLRHLPETLAQRMASVSPVSLLHNYGQLLREPRFTALAAMAAFSTGVFFAFMAGAPFVVVNGMGYSPKTYALAFILISAVFGIGSFIASRYSSRWGIDRMLRLGLGLTILGSVIAAVVQFFVPPTLFAFFMPMSVVALGNGIAQPNTIAAAVSVRPQMAGTASGLLGAGQMLLGALMTLVVGLVEAGSGMGTALVMAACGIAAQGARQIALRLSC